MDKLYKSEHVDGNVYFHCPGCKCDHYIGINPANPPAWDFNGDYERPTINPSIRVMWPEAGVEKCCHSYVRDGYIQFLDDCTHELAGQTVELPQPFYKTSK